MTFKNEALNTLRLLKPKNNDERVFFISMYFIEKKPIHKSDLFVVLMLYLMLCFELKQKTQKLP